MKNAMTVEKFNQDLKLLIDEAVQDNKINIYELLGSLTAAQQFVDRLGQSAVQAKLAHAMAHKDAPIILPATSIPPQPQK